MITCGAPNLRPKSNRFGRMRSWLSSRPDAGSRCICRSRLSETGARRRKKGAPAVHLPGRDRVDTVHASRRREALGGAFCFLPARSSWPKGNPTEPTFANGASENVAHASSRVVKPKRRDLIWRLVSARTRRRCASSASAGTCFRSDSASCSHRSKIGLHSFGRF